MILSRTSRILLGFLLLALAAFLWVNYFVNGPGLAAGFLRAAPAPTAGSSERPSGPPTVAPVGEPQVARELDVLDLPFVVTEPPAQEPIPEREAPGAVAATPTTARRATVNPFSPIIQAAPVQAQQQPEPAESLPTAITEVPIPRAPTTTGATETPPAPPQAPAPAPITPDARASTPLPRALPGGTLGTSQLLRSAIGTPIRAQESLAQEVTVHEPQEALATPEPREPQEEQAQVRQEAEPQPLPEPVAEQEAVAVVPSEGGPPLAAGTSPLARYLRDNDVRFTGSVIGPVSVGVFRSALTQAPVVISLGQTLPETSIVLTDLRGQQAELTLGENTQILTLELRR